MTIEHRLIADADRHEPKGASSAINSTVYVSDGAGSGVWKKPDSTVLSGLNGDLGVANKIVESDGSNGFKFVTAYQYGSMVITNNTNAFTCTTAADSTLNSNSDYILVTGTGAPWSSENLQGITFSTDRLTVPIAGVYRISLWGNIIQFPSNTAKVGVKFKINGTTFSSRKVLDKSNSAGDAGNVNANGLLSFNSNDFIQIFIASTAAGGIIFSDFNLTLELVKAA